MLDAAEIAGLNCLRLMSETAAAALCYGIYKDKEGLPEKDPGRKLVIVDMGHSSVQCALVEFFQGRLRVQRVSSDACLGGRDFDYSIFEHLGKEFDARYRLDVRSSAKASARLLLECERLKRQMSVSTFDVPFGIECFMQDTDVASKINRSFPSSSLATFRMQIHLLCPWILL